MYQSSIISHILDGHDFIFDGVTSKNSNWHTSGSSGRLPEQVINEELHD